MTVKRFEASLTTGNWPCNPERLVRKPDGDFVLYSDYAKLEQAIKRIEEVVNEQAEDEGIWFAGETAPEAYLQQELRRLHTIIESSAAKMVEDV